MGDALAGLPSWARVAGILGFPTVVCAFFLAQNAGYIANPNAAALVRIEKLLWQHVTDINDIRTKQVEAAERLATALKIICENAAVTLPQQRNCANIK